VLIKDSKTLTYSPPNRYNDEIMEAEDLFDRIRMVVEMADAFVVLKGSTGTLTELLHAWEHQNMGKTNAPLICFGNHWRNITEQLDNGRKAIPLKELKFVDSLEELREALEKITKNFLIHNLIQ
jgi:predicted Rossmann-fold nucleotide-binding protein